MTLSKASNNPEAQIKALQERVKHLQSGIQDLTLLNNLAVDAGRSLEVDQLLDLIVAKSVEAVKAKECSILLLTKSEDAPLKTLIRQRDQNQSRLIQYKVGASITGWVTRNKKPLKIDNLAKDSRFQASPQEKKDIKSALCLPILVKGELLGLLLAINKHDFEPFSNDDLRLLAIVSSQSGQLIRNLQLQEKAREAEKEKLANERQVNNRLRHLDKLKDAFLANTSHELRTPLNGIIGLAESLFDDPSIANAANVRQNLSMMISSGKRLANLVNDILDFSKLKSHHLQLKRKPVDLFVLTDLVIKVTIPLLGNKQVTLQNKVQPDTEPVDADENRLEQILHNLIGNAIKFTETGSIALSASRNKGMLEVSITDSGIGIPKEKLESIFKSFEQVDASIAREYGGTGLGLAVTKQLVELHGGKIWVQSKPGKGTTFTFSIPVSKEKPEIAMAVSELATIREVGGMQSIAESAPGDNQDGKFKILIVDDEPVNQQVLANHLSQANYAFTQAMNGEEALKLLEADERFDLVLLDIMMPRMSGYLVCQKIRETHMANELPVIMVTAKNQIEDLVEGLASGANDYLAKPFSKDELLARIKTQLNLLKINSAYGRFVPNEFLQYLQKESIVDVRLGDHIQMDVTIFVSDLRGFTKISEKMTPAENFDFINQYFGLASPLIRQNQGFIDRYTGDSIMALFPQNAEDAIDSAVATLKELRQYNFASLPNDEPLQIGVGIHSGKLMLGIVGEAQRMQGDIFSDAVNLTNRIEGLCKLYGASIVVSNDTLEKLENRDKYHTRFLGKVRVVGKDKFISLFEVYSGDADEMIALKHKTKADFEQGLDNYFAKEFPKAAVSFQTVLNLNPADKTAKLYFERSAQLMVQTVPEDWEGVEVVERK